MSKKVCFIKSGIFHIESIDESLDQSVYLNRFENSIIVDEKDFPSFNNAAVWEIENGKIVVNLQKAKEEKKQILRLERNSFLEETDCLFLQCLSMGKDPSIIKERQQYLRDITNDVAIDNASKVEDLDAITINDWSPPVIKDLPNAV